MTFKTNILVDYLHIGIMDYWIMGIFIKIYVVNYIVHFLFYTKIEEELAI